MDDASGQLGNNGTEIGYLVSGKNGVRFAISKVAELPPRGAVIQPVTQFVLHSLYFTLSPCFLLLFFISALISFFTALYCLYCSLFKTIFISRSLSSFKLHSAFITRY